VGVAASYRSALPQRWGWHCSVRDGVVMAGMVAQGRWRQRIHASLVRRHGVVLGERGAGVRPFSRVPPSSFESAVRRPYESARHSVTKLTLASPPRRRTVAGMASPRELAEHRRDMIPRRVRGTARRGFVFYSGTCKCQNIKCPCRGSRYGGGELVRASSEAEPHLRGRRLSSEAEPHPRGRPALKRGGTSPEGATSPRARWNLTRGGDRPSSEAETR
jgi:hypothetical protein